MDELGQVFCLENDRARLGLERLEEDGVELDQLDGMLVRWQDEVDVFDAVGLHGDGRFHSNLLGWLLDPSPRQAVIRHTVDISNNATAINLVNAERRGSRPREFVASGMNHSSVACLSHSRVR